MLYIFDEFDKLGDGFAKLAWPLLPEQRREKVSRLRTGLLKAQSVAVYLLLRYGLVKEFGIDEAVEFSLDAYGKPSLSVYPHIHFSLSHSDGAAACAISKVPVGADVQRISSITDNMAKRVLTDGEYSLYRQSGQPDEFFCRLWSMKEAFLKMTGRGIVGDMRGIAAEDLSDMSVMRFGEYFCAVTGSGVEVVRVAYIELADFAGKR